MNPPFFYQRSPDRGTMGAPPTLWRAFAGYGVWAVCFTVLYSGHALGCLWILTFSNGSPSVSPSGVNAVLTGIWLFFVFYVLVLTVRSGIRARNGRAALQCGSRFMVMLTFIADASSAVVTVITGLPIILTPACV